MQREHDLAWDLVNQFPGGKGDPVADRSERHRIAQDLVALESAHDVAEEMLV